MTNKEFALWVYNAAKNVSDIDPLFVAAQAALESGWGKSGIGNNLFGITKGSSWNTTYNRFDEIRLSNIARWTENFTPPTQAY